MLQALAPLVNQESPSSEVDLLDACAEVLARIGAGILGFEPHLEHAGGKPSLLWSRGAPRVLVLCHLDTVWPRGTVARWPFSTDGTRATGPGVLDMKGGIVQGLFALAAIGVPEGFALLVTSDEEVGSAASRALIQDLGRRVQATLVLEPALEGALKIARKGVAGYTLTIDGLAAHASQPELGVNATVEMAHQALAIAALADEDAGTTCSPTVVSSGTAANTIPARATLVVDSRAGSLAEQQRIDEAVHRLQPALPGTRLTLTGGPNRAPMPESVSRELFARAQSHAAQMGLPEVRGVTAPGGSDGQLTAEVGTPTLDGLGAVGANAHAEGEYLEVEAMPERAALVAALVSDLLESR